MHVGVTQETNTTVFLFVVNLSDLRKIIYKWVKYEYKYFYPIIDSYHLLLFTIIITGMTYPINVPIMKLIGHQIVLVFKWIL